MSRSLNYVINLTPGRWRWVLSCWLFPTQALRLTSFVSLKPLSILHLPSSVSAIVLLLMFFGFVAPVRAVTDQFTTAGTSSWTAPAGATSVTVEAWGAGGTGGGATGNTAKGGGGAGGQYATKVVTVTPGNSYTIVVGAGVAGTTGTGSNGGDSTFATTTVVAKGGAGGTVGAANNSTATAGSGSTTGGVGTIVYAGGNGSNGVASVSPATGGAGGGGAGSNGAGNPASGNTAGSGTTNGGGNGAAAMTTGGSCTNTALQAGGGGCGGYANSNTNRAGNAGAAGQVLITYVATTITTGTDPAAATIAPGAAATDVNLFTLQTSSGTETVSSVTVNLSTNSGTGLLTITDNAGAVLGSTASPAMGSNTISVSGMTATTTLTNFKVRVTPLTHALMPVPPGALYAITAPVTAWGGTNAHLGSDTNTNALTIDNLSPASATLVSGSLGSLQNTLNWKSSVSADFASTGGSVIYRWAAASAGSEVPVEGSTPTLGSTNGTATVACVVSSATSTALSKIDGLGGSTGECTTTALSAGTTYTYKVFQKDSSGNYDTGVSIGSFAPYGTVSASVSTVVATPTVQVADTNAFATITVTLKDSAGTPVPGKTVSLVAGSGSSIITTVNGISNASGIATFTVKDGTVEGPITYTATDTTDSIVIIQTAQVNFMNYTCFSDSFTSLNAADWYVTGTYIPNVVSGRLRMIPATTYLRSMAQLERWFPGANNRIVLTFDYFAYGGTGADGLSVVLSDASTTPAPGGYGGSLGYAQTNTPVTSGFNGGWLGIGLDEYGNFPNTTESRTGYPTGWTPPAGANTPAGTGSTIPNSVAVRGSGSGTASTEYRLLANTGSILPALWTSASTQTTPHRYRITFDHSNSINGFLSVQRDTTGTGNSYTTLIPAFDVKATNSGQSAVPTNFYLSFTASTGAATDIHEFDNVLVCGTYLVPVGGAALHHLQITGNSSGPTCQPTSLTIKACADSACTGYTSQAVSGTLTASTGVNWDPTGIGATAAFTIPAGSISITKPVLVSTTGVTTFGINSASITPAATNTTTCYLGVTNSCDFTGTASGISVTVPNHISCTNPNVTLTGCGSTFANNGRTIKLYTTYNNPASGTKQATATFLDSSGNTSTVTLATSAPGTTLSNLKFNSSATASSLTISYPDVGQLGLNATYTGSSATGDAGVNMNGSATFIAVPASFQFSGITAPPSLVAGKNFSATVTSLNQCSTPATTPNFGMEAAPESVTLSHTKPSNGGAVDGLFSGAVGSFSNGIASSSNLNWSEVGKIDLVATLTSGNYLGSGIAAATGSTGSLGAVGAFIPDHFNTAVTQGCSAGAYTYSGQPFNATVTAMNGLASSTTTINYAPPFSKNVTISDANAVAGTLSPTSVAGTSFTAGMASVTPTYTFTTNPTTPSIIKLRAIDTSSVSSATGTEGTSLIYSGCFNMINNYGSELLDLALPLTAQYWNGSNWITNTNDSCTNTTLGFTAVGTDITGKTCVIESANNSGKGCGTTPAISNYQFLEAGLSGTDSNGVAGFFGNFNLWLKAPGTGNTGAIDVTASTPAWLQCNFRNYKARATFGIYTGNPKNIYFRELY